ncbi:MAG: hypothetical protein JJU34_18475 [Lunatimonas sp.]|uniref:RHS repeat-associated core domain-containing protein n=1 Tax=Lunatimonas sp. TaxID=2060141 RepID=UPI00263AF6E1|nr:RHS repeat-associated core domain-containing protein [Lunatimonas sp.]MCC5939271.1 hypothetical protein [Lunatimonas sp.]
MTEAAYEDGTNREHERLYSEVVADEPGYFYIYLSNDGTEGGEAYFDDFTILTLESYIVQQTDFYPYGLIARNFVRAGEKETKELFQGKAYEELTGWYDFHARQYDAALGRWFGVDPQDQFASPYLAMGNNPVMMVDPDGELAWFVPIIIGAVVGGTAGGVIAHNNGQDWWKGAIVGGLIGAAVGTGVSAAVGAKGGITGITVGNSVSSTAPLTKAWGITSTAIQSANVNMAITALGGGNLDNVYKSGLVGAASGAFTASGGFGMVSAWGSKSKGMQFAGRQLYQGIGTAGRSIGNNWAMGRDPFSRVTVGAGPVNLTFGKGQRLLQWQNNIGNIATNAFGLGNLAFGGNIKPDFNNLTFVYSGGIIDRFADPTEYDSGFGAFSVIGNSNVNGEIYPHELHHLWQSRSMGDAFLPNYATNGVFGLILNKFKYFTSYGGNRYPAFISPTRNFFETIPDFFPWW